MTKFEQRRLKRMQNPEFAAGYRAMGAEIQLVLALEAICEHRHISQETLAERMEETKGQSYIGYDDRIALRFEHNSRYHVACGKRG